LSGASSAVHGLFLSRTGGNYFGRSVPDRQILAQQIVQDRYSDGRIYKLSAAPPADITAPGSDAGLSNWFPFLSAAALDSQVRYAVVADPKQLSSFSRPCFFSFRLRICRSTELIRFTSGIICSVMALPPIVSVSTIHRNSSWQLRLTEARFRCDPAPC
jgi:hypothetical protein